MFGSLAEGAVTWKSAAWPIRSMSFTVSLYAQQVLGLSPLQFGLGTAVMTGMTLVGSYLAQGLVTRVGPRPVAAVSMGLVGVGSLLLAQVSARSAPRSPSRWRPPTPKRPAI